jgi:hypothetical protein
MPVTAEKARTTNLDLGEVAELLGVTKSAVSGAAHNDGLVKGYHVAEWANWHPRGKTIRSYDVPHEAIRRFVPPDEYGRYGIYDTNS